MLKRFATVGSKTETKDQDGDRYQGDKTENRHRNTKISIKTTAIGQRPKRRPQVQDQGRFMPDAKE